MHNLNTFGVKTNNGQTHIHNTHHNPNMGEATTFPLIVYFVPFHETHIQMAFCPIIPTTGTRVTLGLITLRVYLRLQWGLNQSCSHHYEISNGMLHITFMWENWGDSWLLVVRSQTSNLIPSLSFGHNLCFKCSNGSREPISDIYVPRSFQLYKERLNPPSFDP